MTNFSEKELQELTELVDFAIDLQQTVVVIRADDKVDYKDAFELPGLLRSGAKGLTGLKGITMADVREAMPQLIERLRSKFALADHELELLIEDSVTALFNLLEVGSRWKNYFRNKATKMVA